MGHPVQLCDPQAAGAKPNQHSLPPHAQVFWAVAANLYWAGAKGLQFVLGWAQSVLGRKWFRCLGFEGWNDTHWCLDIPLVLAVLPSRCPPSGGNGDTAGALQLPPAPLLSLLHPAVSSKGRILSMLLLHGAVLPSLGAKRSSLFEEKAERR